jgi:hypothetical protein
LTSIDIRRTACNVRHVSDSLKVQDKKLVLTGATRDALKNPLEFKYAKE